MALATAALAAGATGSSGVSLFDYNRKNFLYDRKMRQETEYQIMEFRIKQAELWREDVKDIIGLTAVKMDTYLIVASIELGFCVMAFCEGRLAAGTPTWLIGCHTLSLSGAFMYLLMSVWLAMHASVTAKAYEVRLLTQHVRLPIPTWAQIEGARTYGSGFEKVNAKQMFRMPFAMGTQESVLNSGRQPDPEEGQAAAGAGVFAGASSASAAPAYRREESARDLTIESGEVVASAAAVESSDVWGLEACGEQLYELDGTIRQDPRNMRHLRLVHEAQQYWQSYDGFARVAMSMGTNQLVTTLAYYVIGYVLISCHAIVACWLAVLLFMVIAAAIIRLDMSLTSFEYKVSVALATLGPVVTAIAGQQWLLQTRAGDRVVALLAPMAYVFHACWLLFLLYVCKVGEQPGGAMLPTGFRSVMYIDIFGWIRTTQPPQRRSEGANTSPLHQSGGGEARRPGFGPAVEAVHYEGSQPVPTRPEALHGASPLRQQQIQREDFEPTTFVPRMIDEEDSRQPEKDESKHLVWNQRPGFAPWRIFFYGTMLLIVLWWITGLLAFFEVQGFHWFKVPPLLNEENIEAENREGIPDHTTAAVSMMQRVAQLDRGVQLPIRWPNARVQPHSLACSSTTGDGIISLSQFGLFVAHLDDLGTKTELEFVAAPTCEHIEGESLNDVALVCAEGSAPVNCSASVLHRQGQLLSICRVSNDTAAPWHGSRDNASASTPRVMKLADSWLSEGDINVGTRQEEVSSLSFAENCRGSTRCAFAETNKHRIVELGIHSHLGEQTAGNPNVYPTRIIQEASALADEARIEHGRLRLIGPPGKPLLGLLRNASRSDGERPRQRLHVMDPHDGSFLGSWALPRSQQWMSMCSTADDLYLLAAGLAPQLWRYPLPLELRREATSAPGKANPSAVASPKATAFGQKVATAAEAIAQPRQPSRALRKSRAVSQQSLTAASR